MRRYIKYYFICIAIMATSLGNLFGQTQSSSSDVTELGAKISSEQISGFNETNLSNALYGQLSGLFVMQGTNSSNVLDDTATLYLRGVSSFSGNTPLILVDGVERDLNYVSIADVESVEVLKDAVASAIYGVRGANGVILVTTKRGTKGFNAVVNYSFSVDTPYRTAEFVDSYDYAIGINQALALDGLSARYTDVEIGYIANGQYSELYPDVDWLDSAYSDFGTTHMADAQFSGGGDRIQYYAALNYHNVTGLLNNTDMYEDLYNSQLNKVYLSMRTNLDIYVTKTTTLTLNLQGSIKEQTRPGVGMSSIISRLYTTPAAAFPVMTSSAIWGSSSTYAYNPIADIASTGTVKATTRSLLGDIAIHQQLDIITKGLYVKASVAYDNMANFNDQRTRSYAYETISAILGTTSNSLIGVTRYSGGDDSELGWSSTINSQTMYSELNLDLGYNISIQDHILNANVSYQQTSSTPSGQNGSRKYQSILTTASWDYKNRYSIDAAVNYSGSSVLTEGSQFNLYPAIGASWNLSNEEFLSGASSLDFLRIRSSVGLSGLTSFTHDLDRQFYGETGDTYYFGTNNSSSVGLKDGDFAIEELLAEESFKFDIGVDASLWNRLQISANYFREKRSNILVDSDTAISSIIGATVPQLCQGVVQNQGVELAISVAGSAGKFRYQVTANGTYAKNKIINNNEGYKSEDYLYTTGNSVSQYYGLQSDGFYNSQEEINNASVSQSFGDLSPGDIRYVDQNNDNVIDSDDVIRLGYSSTPEIYCGLNIDLSYSGFSINAIFQGVANRSVYLNTASVYKPLINSGNISTWYYTDNIPWTYETAEQANLPRLTTVDNDNNYQRNDIWLQNGNYLKLRNLDFGYTFNHSNPEKTQCRLYIAGSNLFSLDYFGYADPENYGIAYPTMRSYTIGLNVNFK